MGSFVERIRLHWKKDAPIIVLGDFNENPFDWIMGSRAGFFATRDRTEATTRPSRGQFDDDKPPLHNPCWKFLPEQPEPPHGTYKFSDDNYSSCRWQWVDQIITSSNIADRIEQLRILHEADAHLLVTADGNPRSKALALPTYSDHLPVEAVFKPE
jgi:endonuclease/exonuclease/phosphatase family metal-dependent hydrolase